MAIQTQFETLASQWSDHCERVLLSSDINDRLDHAAYRDLVSLGDEAIPYIMDRYQDDDSVPWGFVLDDITGKHIIEDRNRFDPSDVQKRWLAWWRNRDADSTRSSSDVTKSPRHVKST